jgi:hypothetical protein
MRGEKSVIQILKKFIDLVSEECKRNPAFAAQIDSLISETKKTEAKKKIDNIPLEGLPDLYSEWYNRGEDEFRIWARSQSVEILILLIKQQGFDPQYKTSKWKDSQKLANFLFEKLKLRISRGGSFLKDRSEK